MSGFESFSYYPNGNEPGSLPPKTRFSYLADGNQQYNARHSNETPNENTEMPEDVLEKESSNIITTVALHLDSIVQHPEYYGGDLKHAVTQHGRENVLTTLSYLVSDLTGEIGDGFLMSGDNDLTYSFEKTREMGGHVCTQLVFEGYTREFTLNRLTRALYPYANTRHNLGFYSVPKSDLSFEIKTPADLVVSWGYIGWNGIATNYGEGDSNAIFEIILQGLMTKYELSREKLINAYRDLQKREVFYGCDFGEEELENIYWHLENIYGLKGYESLDKNFESYIWRPKAVVGVKVMLNTSKRAKRKPFRYITKLVTAFMKNIKEDDDQLNE